MASVTKTVTEGYAELANPLYQRDIEDIVPGEGAVVQRGVQKVTEGANCSASALVV